MNLQQIIATGSFAEYQKYMQSQTRVSRGDRVVKRRLAYLPKFKPVGGSHGLMIIPAKIALPFDLFDPENPEVNEKNYQLHHGAPTSTLNIIKIRCQDPEHGELICAKLEEIGITQEMLESFNPQAVMNRETIEKYSPLLKLRKVAFYGAMVQKMKFSDDEWEYGNTYMIPVEVDSDGNLIDPEEVEPLCLTAHRMENLLIAQRAKEIRKSYEEGGENADRNKTEMEGELKELNKTRMISNPIDLGILRMIYVPTNANYEPIAEKKQVWESTKKFNTMDCYQKCDYAKLQTLNTAVGSKYDAHFDYFTFKLQIPEPKKDEDVLALYTNQNISAAGSDDNIDESFTGFSDVMRESLDDFEQWGEEPILKSVREFKILDEASLRHKIKNDLTRYQAELANPVVYNKYSELLMSIDEELSTAMLESTLTQKPIEVDESDMSDVERFTETDIGAEMDAEGDAALTDQFMDAISGELSGKAPDVEGDEQDGDEDETGDD